MGEANMTYPRPYQGNIDTKNMTYPRPYQGNIGARNLQHGRLYQGSIRQEDFRPQAHGSTAARNKAYKYYQLPPDYYGNRKRNRMKTPSAKDQHQTENSQQQQQPAVKPRREKAGSQRDPKQPAVDHVDTTEQKTAIAQQKNTRKQVKESVRQPDKNATTNKRHKDKPPERRKPPEPSKPPIVVSPFPPASPEPRRPTARQLVKVTPAQVEVRSFDYVTRPEPVFPPIMPVSLEDYARTDQTRKAAVRPRDITGVQLLRFSRFSPSLSEPRDTYQDSLARSFSGVPGYNAVGSMLRSLNMYQH